jgi:hypothetical protein
MVADLFNVVFSHGARGRKKQQSDQFVVLLLHGAQDKTPKVDTL